MQLVDRIAGRLLAGKYRIEAELASGGMAIVYQAWHTTLEQPIAVKILRPEYADNVEAVERFRREAQAMARLRGDHSIRVLDVGSTDDDTPFMVLELLDGIDLRQLLRHRGPLSVSDAIGFMLQAAHAVAEAHAHGLIHRDLKPDNLFLATRVGEKDTIKLIDFGISKWVLKSSMHTTQLGNSLGSPQYMSPEQIRSAASVDLRTDVWSLGVTFYEMATGSCPFNGTTLPAVCASIAYDDPLSPRQLRPDLPQAFEKVILRCLAKKPEARYDSMLPLIAELACLDVDREQASVSSQSQGRVNPEVVAVEDSRGHVVRAMSAASVFRKAPHARARHAVVAAGVVALASVALYFVTANDKATVAFGTSKAVPPSQTLPPSPVEQRAQVAAPDAWNSKAASSARGVAQGRPMTSVTFDELGHEERQENLLGPSRTPKANQALPGSRANLSRAKQGNSVRAPKARAEPVSDRVIEARYGL